MYPFASVRWAWDALWAAVHERAPWTPPTLTFTNDVHASWNDPLSVVNHICGWPLAKFHQGHQRVVGAFGLTIPNADGFRYRSTLLSTRASTVDQLLADRVTVAVNSSDSLSGWISFLAAADGDPYTGPVVFTAAHVESVRTLQRGEAELACIDSWSLALLDRDQPELTEGLNRVGLGPLIPTPAITVRDTVTDTEAEQLAAAIGDAVGEQASETVRSALLIDRFHRVTFDDYLPVLDLATW